MNRIDIQELSVHIGSPAITIIAPSEKTVLEQKVMALIPALNLESFEMDAIKKQVLSLINHIILPKETVKIGLFINKHIARVYLLAADIVLIEKVDNHFHLDEIVKSLNRKERYWVLACNPGELIFYEGFGDLLIEVIHTKTGLSWKHGQPIGSLQGTLCSNQAPMHCMYTNPKDFYRELDVHLDHYIEQDPAPLLIYGKMEHQQMFKQYSHYAQKVCAYIQSLNECSAYARECYDKLYMDAFARISSGDQNVLLDKTPNYQYIATAAIEGAIETLLVAKDFHKLGCEDKITGVFTIHMPCAQDVNTIDIIDALIETVKAKRGLVLFVPSNLIERYNSVVAFTRF